ncbi:MAG: sigma-70 family RNA polymerase sigma factor [Thermomicrobium sp.]|nr:sigma-70 family RNA polymerase sigma factor [Thermomicrobium sp.]
MVSKRVASAQPTSLTDEELAERFRGGDETAFATLYERYVDRIYDFVARLLGDREAAADVTQETFLKALQGLRARRIQGSVRAWLFTIARNAAIDHLRRRRTTPFSQLPTPEGEEWEPEVPASGPEAEPEETARRRELAELVWLAARGLNPADYALLDLSLRHDLTPAELAQVVGMRRGAVNTRLSRLRDALEESLTALLLARWGRGACAELDRILDGVALPGGLTPELRRSVARHVESCETCQRNRHRVASAAELLPALAPIVPTAETRAALDAAVRDGLAAAPAGVSHPLAQARNWLTGTAAGKAVLGLVAAVSLLIGATGGWLAFGTAGVTATTSGCPPLELRLGMPGAVAARLLGVPERFPPGEPQDFRLPAGTLVVTVTTEAAELRLAGVPVEIRLAAPLADVRWDGGSLLGHGTAAFQVARGSTHRLELVCR